MKLLYSFLKDMKISFKTFYIYIEILMALIFIAVILFVVPENFTSNAKIYINIDDSFQKDIVIESLAENTSGATFLDSMDDIRVKLEKEKNSMGLKISTENDKVIYDIVLQGYESQRFRNVVEKSFVSNIAEKLPNYEKVTKITTLSGSTEKLTDRLNMLPVFLVLNSSFLGLFIIATYIFMDKDEGTIRAFAVTPAKVWEYLLSKMGVMLVTGIITALLTTIIVAGSKPHYYHLILLLIATNVFGTSLGLFISSFYDSIMKAMGALMSTVLMLSFATVSYYMPSFSPILIKILPSYPMLFAFREVFLNELNLIYVYSNIIGFSVLAVIFFMLANKRFKKTLMV